MRSKSNNKQYGVLVDRFIVAVLFSVSLFACGRIGTQVEVMEPIPVGYRRITVQPNFLISNMSELLKGIKFASERATLPNSGEDSVSQAISSILAQPSIRKRFSIMNRSLEGYIIAGNYYINPSETAFSAILSILEKSYRQYASEERIAKAKSLGLSPRHLLTLASIIQRETCGRDEMPRIASVLYNRIAKSMPLQVDVSLLYLLGRWDGHLTKQELKIRSPYNTYISKGLPPTPIGSPSLDAVDAVLNPDKTDYLFFAASGKCKHYFSANYQDHDYFVSRFLRTSS